jgi:DNA-binding NarL/FixJ family response regulator
MKRASAKTRIRVLLAEDHTVVREGLRALLEAEGDIQVVGEAATGRKAVELARALRPEVVVMDIAMPQLNGLEATRQIHRALPGTKVLVLSAHSDDAYVEQVVAMGAVGYLLKETSAHVLSQAVRHIHQGNTFFSPSIVRSAHIQAGQTPGRGKRAGKKNAALSSREAEVLQLIAEGLPNKQVAAELGISVKTVEKHRQRLMEKLDIHDIAGLTRYAIAAGIVEGTVSPTSS